MARHFPRSFFISCFAAVVCLDRPDLAHAEDLLRDLELLKDPVASAATAGRASKGPVKILEKKGFWARVRSGQIEGWVKLSDIAVDKADAGLSAIETGRKAAGNIVSTSGVRGLDGGDLQNAKPDLRAFEDFQKLRAGKDQARQFASAVGLATRQMESPRPAPVASQPAAKTGEPAKSSAPADNPVEKDFFNF